MIERLYGYEGKIIWKVTVQPQNQKTVQPQNRITVKPYKYGHTNSY